MTPCIGCKKREEINLGIKGNFWMKFVGRPNGKLMKHAPGNYTHGQNYKVPYGNSKFKYWEMLEPEPVLEAPELSPYDDVFEDVAYVPDEPEPEVTVSAPVQNVEMPTHTPMMIDGVDYNPNAPAILEPYSSFSPATGMRGEHREELVPNNREQVTEPVLSEEDAKALRIKNLKAELELLETIPEPEPEEEVVKEVVEEHEETLDRNELLGILTQAGKVIKKGTRTTTLKKMVDALEATEE